MKKFISEFKTFITRGNAMDMAVGVIVGGAFSAIVNALTENILRPVINWIISLFMSDATKPAYTILKGVTDADGVLDLTKSIYIDWGAFISAILNFLLIALVLFFIVKLINTISVGGKKANEDFKRRQAAIKKYRSEGISAKEAVARYEAEERQKNEAAAKAEQAKAEQNTRLLEEIRDLLKNK